MLSLPSSPPISPFNDSTIQNLDPTTKFLIGVCTFIAFSALSSLGLNLQALSLQAQRQINVLRAQELANELAIEAEFDDEFDSLDEDVEEVDDDYNLYVERDRETKPLLKSGVEIGYGAMKNSENGSGTSNAVHPSGLYYTSTSNSLPSQSLTPQTNSTPLPSPRRPKRDTASPTSPQLPSESQKQWTSFFIKWQWYLGLSLYISTQVFGSVVALIFISPMVLAPLGSSGLIFNVLFSSFFLGTKITSVDWMGTLLIVFGCSLVSVYGDVEADNAQTIGDLMRLYSRPAFIIYFTIQNTFALAVFVILKYLESFKIESTSATSANLPTHASNNTNDLLINSNISTTSLVSSPELVFDIERQPQPELHLPTSSSHHTIHRSFENSQTRVRKPSERSQRSLRRIQNISSRLHVGKVVLMKLRAVRRVVTGWFFGNLGVLFAVVGGIMASETLLLTKSGIELLLTTVVDGDSDFQGLISLSILAVLGLTIVLQLYCLNRALYHSHPVLAIPLFFTVFTCASLSGSVVYFNTFSKFSVVGVTGVLVGLVCLVGGVWLLRESQASGHDVQKRIEMEAKEAEERVEAVERLSSPRNVRVGGI